MRSDSVYRRPWWLGLLVFAIVLGVDITLLAPGVSWIHDSQDSGDLICSAYFLGIPHPTGYPLYCMLAKIFQTIVPVNSIAWRTNLFSTLCAALACAVLSLLMHRLLSKDPRRLGLPAWIIPMAAGLALGFSRTFLSQSLVSEVYTLNALFVTVDLLLILEVFHLLEEKTGDAKIRRIFIALALAYGLTLTNHLSSAFIFPLVLAPFVFGRRALNGRTALLSVVAFFIGLLPYIYLPLRSAANTPFDWGNPQTLGGFYWVISGSQFKHLMFVSFDYQVIHRLFDRFEPTAETGFVLTISAIWGTAAAFMGGSKARGATLALCLVMLNITPVMDYHIGDTQSFLLPTFIGLAILAMIGLDDAMRRLASFRAGGLVLPAFIVLVIACAVPYAGNLSWADASGEYRPMEYADAVYETLPERSLLIEKYYGQAFTMWYKHYIDAGDERKDVAVIYSEHLQFDWGVESLRRQFPWVNFPDANPHEEDAIASLVELNARTIPTYISRDISSLNDSWIYEPSGEVLLLKPLEK